MFFQQFWWIWLEIYNPSIDLILIDGHQHYIITPNINVDFGNVFFSSLVPLQNTIGVAHWYIGVSKVQVHIVKNILIEVFLIKPQKSIIARKVQNPEINVNYIRIVLDRFGMPGNMVFWDLQYFWNPPI